MERYICKSGRHQWSSKADADKCCNGYRRDLVLDERWFDPELNQYGGSYHYEWTQVEPGQERPAWAR